MAAAALTAELETELIRACRRGESRMYEPLVRAYEPRAIRIATGMLGDGDAARDVTQEAFVLAWTRLDRFEIGRPFAPWFFRILRNRCLDEIRRVGTRSDYEGAVDRSNGRIHGVAAPHPERAAERREARDLVWEALHALPTEQRELLVLREMDGLSYGEIAATLGVPEGTIASRLFYARRALRDALDAAGAGNHLEDR